MGDAGEGLVDAEARIQERMEELERARREKDDETPRRDPGALQAMESLRLAKIELERQLQATSHEGRRAQLVQAIADLDRRMAAKKAGKS